MNFASFYFFEVTLAFQLNQKVNHSAFFNGEQKKIPLPKFFLFIKEQQFNQTTKANKPTKNYNLQTLIAAATTQYSVQKISSVQFNKKKKIFPHFFAKLF
jgi:hypothetical protein